MDQLAQQALDEPTVGRHGLWVALVFIAFPSVRNGTITAHKEVEEGDMKSMLGANGSYIIGGERGSRYTVLAACAVAKVDAYVRLFRYDGVDVIAVTDVSTGWI